MKIGQDFEAGFFGKQVTDVSVLRFMLQYWKGGRRWEVTQDVKNGHTGVFKIYSVTPPMLQFTLEPG